MGMKRPTIEEIRALSASDYSTSIEYIEGQIDDAYEMILSAARAGETEVPMCHLDERALDYLMQQGFTVKSSSIGIKISWDK